MGGWRILNFFAVRSAKGGMKSRYVIYGISPLLVLRIIASGQMQPENNQGTAQDQPLSPGTPILPWRPVDLDDTG